MIGDDYRTLAARQELLRAARCGFSEDEYAHLRRALEQLSSYELSTLQDIAPSANGDTSWAPIAAFVGDDASPDDMIAVSTAANHLESLSLIEIQTPSEDGAGIDLMRFRATELGRRFVSAVRTD